MSEAEARYTANMEYSAAAVRRLTELQHSCFRLGEKILQSFCGIILLFLGLYLKDNRIGILSIACGCFILVTLNLKPKMAADQLCRQYGDRFPSLAYSFSDTGLITQQVTEETPYASLTKLVDDGKYLFLFLNPMTVYMIEKETVAGSDGADGLKAFLSEKTALEWDRPFSFLRFRWNGIARLFSSRGTKGK